MTEESLFAAALERPTAADRRAFLKEACAGDEALRQRLERLLAAHERTLGILDQPAVPPGSLGDTDGSPLGGEIHHGPRAGTVVAGRYKLLEEIGTGGMGTVWVAEQTQPVRRKVALKLIKTGMDSKSVMARFDAERQALALMDHPNIAKVLDGGVTEGGRPFFVMEYVKGVPLTQYCDDARLGIAERLALFVPICQAVQHAHTKGIVHRDLKPSNILICLYDGQPVPKVIDFGLAKAMRQPLTELTLHTAHDVMLGTPLYMSPEQAELNNLDVDARTDIYALGVILYELLTGTTPLERQRFKEAAWHELLRLIREEDPPRPSVRLSGSASLPSVAAQRQLDPSRLTRRVRGDLDWIVMKCLEKDRSRRYDTASALASDIRRHLADESVEACPPSASYRLRKAARKHRVILSAAASIALFLVAAAAVSTWLAVRATRAEAASRRAERRASGALADALKAEEAARMQRDRAVAERERADEERAIAQAVNEFLQQDLLGQADIANQAEGAERNKDITVRELLDRAALGIEPRFKGRELTEAAIRLTLGKAYRALGEYAEARKHLERSLELRRRRLGDRHRDTLESEFNLALLYDDLGLREDSERLHKQVLEARGTALGADHPDTLTSMNYLGLLYCDLERFDEAEPLLRRAMERRRAELGDDHVDTLGSMANLAYMHLSRREYASAEPLYKRAWEGWRARLGPDHPETLKVMAGLAITYMELDRPDEAEPLFKQDLATSLARLGPHHPDTLTSMHNLGALYRDLGRYDEAEPLLRDAAAGAAEKLGLGHPKTPTFINNYVDLHDKLDTPHLAEPLLRKLVTFLRDEPGTDPAAFAQQLWFLSNNLSQQEKYAEAEATLRESLDVTARHEPDSWRRFYLQSLLGDSLLRQGRHAEAEPPLIEGYRGMKAREDQVPERFRTLIVEAAGRLVELYEAWGQPEKAAEWREKLPTRPEDKPGS